MSGFVLKTACAASGKRPKAITRLILHSGQPISWERVRREKVVIKNGVCRLTLVEPMHNGRNHITLQSFIGLPPASPCDQLVLSSGKRSNHDGVIQSVCLNPLGQALNICLIRNDAALKTAGLNGI